MYSSGSTGTARAYGFTRQQLDTVARWYTDIYKVTAASLIVTSLPVEEESHAPAPPIEWHLPILERVARASHAAGLTKRN